MRRHNTRLLVVFNVIVFCVLPSTAFAYIGPGAGFAVISSFFVFLITGFLAFFTLLFWPFRAGILYFRRRLIRKNKKVRRVVVLGLDGLDPGLSRGFIDSGLLPNFSKLMESGSFRPLATTKPSISPVAWSSFATGVNPGKHRIFDFYTRDSKSYLPVLSSVDISTINRPLKLGPLKIPRTKTNVRFLRKATSFWNILGKHGIFSNVLRVPISFPPEKFYGASLSAMCAPDLRGTQGAFTCFCSNPPNENEGLSEGIYVPITKSGDKFQAPIQGPRLSTEETPLIINMSMRINDENNRVDLYIHKERHTLQPGVYSPWIKLVFKAGAKTKISGIARFLLIEIEPDFKLYMSPINIDPEKPSLRLAEPFY